MGGDLKMVKLLCKKISIIHKDENLRQVKDLFLN